jgi:hypothetical protein
MKDSRLLAGILSPVRIFSYGTSSGVCGQKFSLQKRAEEAS